MIKILCVSCVKHLDLRNMKRISNNSKRVKCQICGQYRYCGQWDIDVRELYEKHFMKRL